MTEPYDLTIIGGGIIGANVFYQARKKFPHWRIILLERDLLSSGASFFSAGLAVPLSRSEWHNGISTRSFALYKKYIQDSPDLAISTLPCLWVVPKDKLSAFHKQINNNAELMAFSPEDELIKKLSLHLSPDDILFMQQDAHIAAVPNVVKQLIKESISSDQGECVEGFTVKHIHQIHNATFTITSETNAQIYSKKIITAMGPWLKSFYPDIKNHNIKKIVALHVNEKPLDIYPIIFFYENGNFLMPQPEKGYWLLSITSQDWNIDPETNMQINANELQLANAFLQERMPHLANKIIGGQVFCDSYTNDRIPIVATEKNNDNHIIIYGCSGSGYRLAPGLAEEALSKLNRGEV